MSLRLRIFCNLTSAFVLLLLAAVHASAQGYPGFPDTIMAPAHGSGLHHRARASKRAPYARTARQRPTPDSRHYAHPHITVARGSSGSVLPTRLPRTQAIPPEGAGVATVHIPPQQQAPTVVPGLANPVPNLPHGTETFQDRASRCAFQQGLYNVPGSMSTQYMGACVQ